MNEARNRLVSESKKSIDSLKNLIEKFLIAMFIDFTRFNALML